MILQRIASLAGGLLLLAGCAAQAPLKAAFPMPSPDPGTQMPALERRIYELVEAERRKLDPSARPLALDSELIGVAREKSTDMAADGSLAHVEPSGKTTATMIMSKDAGFQGLLGEAVAAQPFAAGYGIDVDIYARRIVEIWLASTPHRKNLAEAAYDRTGIGAVAKGNTIYVTELFASDLGLMPPPGTPSGPTSPR